MVFQTPEKKQNDQRNRKRKAEPYETSQGSNHFTLKHRVLVHLELSNSQQVISVYRGIPRQQRFIYLREYLAVADLPFDTYLIKRNQVFGDFCFPYVLEWFSHHRFFLRPNKNYVGKRVHWGLTMKFVSSSSNS